MEVLLDTNFIIACLKKKISIEEKLNEIIKDKVEIVLLNLVKKELENFKNKKNKRLEDKNLVEVFLKMLKENCISTKIKEVNQKNPDEALKVYCDKNPSCVLATLDKELRKKVKNRLITIKGKSFSFV